MTAQQSAQLSSQSHPLQKKPRRWLAIVSIITFAIALVFFIGASVYWIGLVQGKLSDTIGAIFTALGTIFGFIALILAIPPFFQYLRDRKSIHPLTNSNPESLSNAKDQADATSVVGLSEDLQHSLASSQRSHLMNQSATSIPTHSRSLSLTEKEQLVDKLLACRTMRNRTSRDQVVQELSFANSIDRASSTTNKDDVMTIISRCLDFSDGLHQLIERIEFREENSQPMQQIQAFMKSLS